MHPSDSVLPENGSIATIAKLGEVPRDTRMLRRQDAAKHVTETFGIPCSKMKLAKLAVSGGGPIFRKAGKFPLYRISDLNEWANAQFSRPYRSTSEYSKNAA